MTRLSKILILPISAITLACQSILASPPSSHHHDHNVNESSLDVDEQQRSPPQSQLANNNKIITLPLMNHHQYIERLRRERRLTPEQEDDQDATRTEADDANANTDAEIIAHAELYQGVGTHYVDLWVGTPNPQRQTLIVDTGSDLTAFPCEPCTDCGHDSHTDFEFKVKDSPTFHLSQCNACWLGECKHVEGFDYCGMEMSYAEGSSWHAYEAKDSVYLGGSHDRAETRGLRLRLLEEKEDERKQEELMVDKNYVKDKDMSMNNGGVLRNMQKDAQQLEEDFMKEAKEAEHAFKEEHGEGHGKDHFSAKDYSFELGFGCQYKITGLFKTQLADGIMGMANSPRSFWTQMYEANMISSKAFALCYTHADKVFKSGTDAGAVTLGGINKDMHTSPMVYAESTDFHGWFGVRINAIYLKFDRDDDGSDTNSTKNPRNRRRRMEGEGGNATITANAPEVEEKEAQEDDSSSQSMVKLDLNLDKINSKGVIVDSGTTESYFPVAMSLPFTRSFEDLMGFRFDSTVHESDGINPHTDYPTIVLQLRSAPDVRDDDLMDKDGHPLSGLASEMDLDHPNDVLLEIPPKNYMQWSDTSKSWTNRLHMTEFNTYGVIGANAMFGHDILFDVDKKQIGFAKSDCVYGGKK